MAWTKVSSEEKLDKRMRIENVWNFGKWRETRTGLGIGEHDGLTQKMTEDEEDMITTIYADDTKSRAAAKTKEELERRNSVGLTKVCQELKALRLKVNEGKTTYMVLATQGIRRRGNLNSQIEVCGKVVKNVSVGKALGLLVSDDLSWRHQTEEVVKSCTAKLHGLWKCTSVLRKDQRKTKAEGIILPRLFYCLEKTSTGLKANMEKLQGIESAAARWVLQRRRRDWSLRSGLKQLGWLSVCQQAAYQTVRLALKVLNEKKPERLYQCLTETKDGQRKRKIIDEEKFMRLKQTTRKAWSSRALRWINMMSEDLINIDLKLKASKLKLKEWIRHRVPVRGDRVLWGRRLGGVAAQNQNQGQEGEAGPRGEGGQDEEDQQQLPLVRPIQQEEAGNVSRNRDITALGVLERGAASLKMSRMVLLPGRKADTGLEGLDRRAAKQPMPIKGHSAALRVMEGSVTWPQPAMKKLVQGRRKRTVRFAIEGGAQHVSVDRRRRAAACREGTTACEKRGAACRGGASWGIGTIPAEERMDRLGGG